VFTHRITRAGGGASVETAVDGRPATWEGTLAAVVGLVLWRVESGKDLHLIWVDGKRVDAGELRELTRERAGI
jgi:hypothetical protein